MRAFEKGFDGVFIAADGHECSYSPKCAEHTNTIIVESQKMMRKKNINPKRIRMAALCSVCAEPVVKHLTGFMKELEKMQS